MMNDKEQEKSDDVDDARALERARNEVTGFALWADFVEDIRSD